MISMFINSGALIRKEETSHRSEALRNVLNEIKISNSNRSNEVRMRQTEDSINKYNKNIDVRKQSINNSKFNDMNDLKNEISLLQNKINGLGKNLCKYFLTKSIKRIQSKIVQILR